MNSLYLDWNATTPPHPDVIAAMAQAASTTWGNPASIHGRGRAARAVVESLREALAELLGFSSRDVVLTSGGTEANNLALRHAPALITSRLEHPSVVRVAEALLNEGRPVTWLPVPESGRLEAESVKRALVGAPAGGVLAVQAANHETGVLQPIAELAALAHEANLRLHVDAVQAVGKVLLPELALADSLAVAAHKLRGPKGIGALLWRGSAPAPILLGGTQERGVRPGTVDPVAAAGFLAALRRARETPLRLAALAAARDELERALAPVARVNGIGPRLPHVSNLSFAGARGDELVVALDLHGVQVSSGSACAAGTAEPSPVITAMLGQERAESAIRVSFGEETTAEALSQAKDIMLRVLSSFIAQP